MSSTMCLHKIDTVAYNQSVSYFSRESISPFRTSLHPSVLTYGLEQN